MTLTYLASFSGPQVCKSGLDLKSPDWNQKGQNEVPSKRKQPLLKMKFECEFSFCSFKLLLKLPISLV